MVKFKSLYTLGDMIVHRSYGVGKIDSIESKPMNGTEVECFKVKTQNGDYWFPTEGKENPRIHPVASQKLIQRVIKILRSAPIDLETDHLQWKDRIDSVLRDGDILAVSHLLRDLAVLKMTGKLNRTQDQALKNLKGRVLTEWAACLAVEKESIQPKLQAYLKESGAAYQNTV